MGKGGKGWATVRKASIHAGFRDFKARKSLEFLKYFVF